MAQPNEPSLRLLEADLQALSLQASRVEGGVFGGLFSTTSGPLDPDVRDAAEDALARLRDAGGAVASDPSSSENATRNPALRAALLACASPRRTIALLGLRCAQRLVTATTKNDELCALADVIGKEEIYEDDDDDGVKRDAVDVAKAQILLRVIELDACFGDDAKVAKGVLKACFNLLASANKHARLNVSEGGMLGPSAEAIGVREGVNNRKSGSGSGSWTRQTDARVVAAEAAASRACERAFEEASRDDSDVPKTPQKLKSESVDERKPSRAFAFGVFCDLCDAAAGDDARAARFACNALTGALQTQPLSVNAIYGFETNWSFGNEDGVKAIKTRLCAALVTKTFSDVVSVASPGARSRRRDSADAVAEGRAATKCASAFLRFAKPRRRDVVERRALTSASASASMDADVVERRAVASKSSFFAFLSPPRDADDAEDAEDEDDSDDGEIDGEIVSSGKETSDSRSADAVSDTLVDPFAAERTLFLGSFASSLEREMAPWRRSAALDALRTVAGDPELLRLARGGAAAGDKKTSDAFGDVTDILARVAEAGVSADTTGPHDVRDAVPLRVAAAFRDASVAARGVSSAFREPEDSDETGHVAHAVFLALDGVLTLCSSLETLADESVFLKDEKYKEEVRHMVDRAWVSLESCLSTAFARVPGEAATLELCRALQALTRAAAAAGAEEAKDACLGSLCAFSVSGNPNDPNQTQKSAHAFRATLNAAQSLVDADALGFRGWFAVLETTRRVEARVVAAEKNVPIEKLDEKLARASQHSNEHARVIDALLASAAALLVSSAALRDEQSADALEAARGSSARELDDAGRAFSSQPKQNVSAPNGVATRPDPDLELRALSRFVDAVLLRVRGCAHEGKGFEREKARGRAAWHTLEAHFRDALETKRDPEVARRACAHLERAVVGALESIALGSGDVTLDVAAVLAPLARAKTNARYLPARLAAVESMSALVRERGDLFTKTKGWASAFDALQAEEISVSNNSRNKRVRKDDASVVVAGWSAVSFVVSDVLPASLGEYSAFREKTNENGVRDGAAALALARVVPLLSSYASQQNDTRTSLSAVNSLWNACDVIARRAESDALRVTNEGSSSPLETVLLSAFEALAETGVDRSRPDVRHSGVNTLVNVLAARGSMLSPGAWRDATLGVFFPLIFEIRARAAAAGDERVDVSLVSSLNSGRTREKRENLGENLGSKRGAGDASDASNATMTDDSETTDEEQETTGRLLVHHSRNTAAKQWDETLSVAVSAIGKLVHKRAARLLAPETRDAFEPVWIRTCAFMVECITRASQETATAALRAARLAATRFASVSVEGEGSDKPVSRGDATGFENGIPKRNAEPRPAPRVAASVRAAARTAHKAVLRDVYETSTRLATRDPDAKKSVTSKTRLELAKTLAEAFASAPSSAFDFDDVVVVVAVADALARAPEPWPEWFTSETTEETLHDDTKALKALKALGSGYAALQTQRACFDALKSLVPNVSDACVDAGTYVSVLFLFLSYVKGSDVVSDKCGSIVPKQPCSIACENVNCVAAACDAFAKLAGDPKLPQDDLACAFADAVAAFKEAMAPRDDVLNDDDEFEKVAAATRAFHATLDRGVPAAQKYVSAAGGADAVRKSWGVIADAFEASVLDAPNIAREKKMSHRRLRERDALRREGLASLRDACARGDSAPEEVVARLVQVLAAGADAEIILDSARTAAAADDKKIARDAEEAFPSLCLARLRDLVLSAGAGPGASSAARLAAPALLDKCESSLRRHAAEESVRGGSDKDAYSFAVSAARASFAARAMASALTPAPGAGGSGGFFFRKETPATILAAAATPERSRAVRAALEACAVSSDATLRDAAGKTLEALSRFEETRA